MPVFLSPFISVSFWHLTALGQIPQPLALLVA
jgi:hypothetical protein